MNSSYPMSDIIQTGRLDLIPLSPAVFVMVQEPLNQRRQYRGSGVAPRCACLRDEEA